VLNPRRFWELVVIVIGISSAGYIALRTIGPRLGLPFAGFIGGFVSATATIGSMGTRAARDHGLFRACVAGAVLTSIATIAQMVVVLSAVSVSTMRALSLPLLFGGISAVGYGVFFLRDAAKEKGGEPTQQGRAFSLKSALLFAGTLFSIIFFSAAAAHWLGTRGLILSAGIAGFADTHSAAISVAALVKSGKITANDAVVPILTGLTTNTATKGVVVGIAGGKRLFWNILPGLVLLVLSAWAGLLVP